MARRGHADSHYLFHSTDFYSVHATNDDRLRAAIEHAAPAEVQQGAVEEVAERFASMFRLDVPELTEGAISVDVVEAEVDVTGDFHYAAWGPGPHLTAGIRASYFVPFIGDAQLFKVKPNTWTSVLPAAAIEHGELRFTFEQPGQNVAQTKGLFDQELARVKQYLGWLRESVGQYHDTLIQTARQLVEARRARLAQLQSGMSSLGIPIRSASPAQAVRAVPATAIPMQPTKKLQQAPPQHYDIALSFAGEDRGYVEQVARLLKDHSVTVFYDGFEKAALWGKNLVDHLADIYQNKSKYVVMFVSAHYVAKAWPTHERQHAQARALLASEEYILPARFDDTPVPGMTTTVGYVDLRRVTPAEFVDLIVQKLGRK